MEWMQRDLSKLDEKDTRLMELIDFFEEVINELKSMRKDHDKINQHDIDFAVMALTETMRDVQVSRDMVKEEMHDLERQLEESEGWEE